MSKSYRRKREPQSGLPWWFVVVVGVVAIVGIIGAVILMSGKGKELADEVRKAAGGGAKKKGRPCDAQWDDDGWCYTAMTMPKPEKLSCKELCCTTYQIGLRVDAGQRSTHRVDCENCLRLHLKGMASVTRRIVTRHEEKIERERKLKRAEKELHRDDLSDFRDKLRSATKYWFDDFEAAYRKGLGLKRKMSYSPPPCQRVSLPPKGVAGRKGPHQYHFEWPLRMDGGKWKVIRLRYHLVLRRTCAHHGKLTWKGRK